MVADKILIARWKLIVNKRFNRVVGKRYSAASLFSSMKWNWTIQFNKTIEEKYEC